MNLERHRPAGSAPARLALVADELRAVANEGLLYAERVARRYDRGRYERVRRLAAEAMALVAEETADELEASFRRRHLGLSPLLGGEGAVFDGVGRVLLIRREDDRLWALPGGLLEVGEGAAEGACREVEEETGVACRAVGLIGVYDNRRQATHGPFHLLHLTFHCEALDLDVEPRVMPECIDVGWFAEDALPPLSSGHERRIPDAFRYRSGLIGTVHDG